MTQEQMDQQNQLSRDSRDFEHLDFHPEPRTQAEYLAALWQKVNVIDMKITSTNGRVHLLEKFMWGIAGGLMVVVAVVVPQWLGLVK